MFAQKCVGCIERRISNHKIIPHINKHRWQYLMLTRLFKRKKCSFYEKFPSFHYFSLFIINVKPNNKIPLRWNDFQWFSDYNTSDIYTLRLALLCIHSGVNEYHRRHKHAKLRKKQKKININKEFIGFWMTWSLWHYLFIPSTFLLLFCVVDVCFSRFARCRISAMLDSSIYLTFFAIYASSIDIHWTSQVIFVLLVFLLLGCWLN